jgi:hypothetical protein
VNELVLRVELQVGDEASAVVPVRLYTTDISPEPATLAFAEKLTIYVVVVANAVPRLFVAPVFMAVTESFTIAAPLRIPSPTVVS